MFDDIVAAVAGHRAAAAAHRQASNRRDIAAMDAAAEQIRSVCAALRARHHPELIFPLTMEWVTLDRDPTEHARYRAIVGRALNHHP